MTANTGNPVVIVDAVRTPIGRRNGGLSSCHSVDVLGTVQRALFTAPGSIRSRSARWSAAASARSACSP